jgi:predicted Fe-S protein YdhL (DUF1289 family)
MTIVTIAQSSAASAASMPVKSPCVGVCQLNADKLCMGCGRSLAEIAEWARASADRQRRIKAEAAKRLAILQAVSDLAPPSSSGTKEQ